MQVLNLHQLGRFYVIYAVYEPFLLQRKSSYFHVQRDTFMKHSYS